MNRLTVLLACCLALGALPTSGQETINAVLQTGDFLLGVDSLGLRFESGDETLATPNFGGAPMIEDTFSLGRDELPSNMVVFWNLRGEAQRPFEIEFPVEEEWYLFPMDDPAQIMLARFEPGIEELPGGALCRLAAEPSLFSARTALSARLDRPGRAVVEIYDATGRPVRRLADARLEPGVHRWTWDATDDAGNQLSPGIYFARLAVDAAPAISKLVLTR